MDESNTHCLKGKKKKKKKEILQSYEKKLFTLPKSKVEWKIIHFFLLKVS